MPCAFSPSARTRTFEILFSFTLPSPPPYHPTSGQTRFRNDPVKFSFDPGRGDILALFLFFFPLFFSLSLFPALLKARVAMVNRYFSLSLSLDPVSRAIFHRSSLVDDIVNLCPPNPIFFHWFRPLFVSGSRVASVEGARRAGGGRRGEEGKCN